MARTLVVITSALLIIGAILPLAAPKEIGYGALEGDNIYGHPEKNPVNPYNRGCTTGEQCRGGRRLLTDVENAVEGAEQGAADMKDKVVNLFQ